MKYQLQVLNPEVVYMAPKALSPAVIAASATLSTIITTFNIAGSIRIFYRLYVVIYAKSLKLNSVSRMQMTLFRSILVQYALLIGLYVVPIIALVLTIAFLPPFSLTFAMLLQFVMIAYTPCHFICLFASVYNCRKELKRLVNKNKRKHLVLINVVTRINR